MIRGEWARAEYDLTDYPRVLDMINIIKLPFVPRACAWIHGRNDGRTLLAVYVPAHHGPARPLRAATDSASVLHPLGLTLTRPLSASTTGVETAPRCTRSTRSTARACT